MSDGWPSGAASGVVVLDGGLATELERRGHDLSDDLWSARLLVEAPEEIIEAHLAFFRAGASVATTASYQASFEGFARRGLAETEATDLMRDSVALAAQARDRYVQERPDLVDRIGIAVSVGPYGAVRADGSEYHGDYGLSDAALRAFHGPRLEVLATAGADVIAVETIPSVQEGAVLLDVLREVTDAPAWLSFSCTDGRRTRRGDDADEAFSLAAGAAQVVAVGTNCTAPEHIEALITRAVSVSGKPAVAYPNSGEAWDAATRQWAGDPGRGISPDDVTGWVAAGARYVGGCCRVTPRQIAEMAAAVEGG